jgi:hypothetical protein
VQHVSEPVQIWPVEQSPAPTHWTHSPVAVLHLGGWPPAAHWALVVQAAQELLTQMGAVAVGHSESAVQLTQAPSLRHWARAAPLRLEHSASPVAMGARVQPRQMKRVWSQMGVVAAVQCEFVTHPTQVPPVRQRGVVALFIEHWLSAEQGTQVLLAQMGVAPEHWELTVQVTQAPVPAQTGLP